MPCLKLDVHVLICMHFKIKYPCYRDAGDIVQSNVQHYCD